MQKNAKKNKIIDTSDEERWLTISQSLDYAGCAMTTLANWRRKKRLNPQTAVRSSPHGGLREVVVYDKVELSRLRAVMSRSHGKVSAGEVAARAFELFDQGLPAREVVTRLRVTPEDAQELRERWESMGGDDLVLTSTAQRELEGILGVQFVGVAGLVGAVRQILSEASRGIMQDAHASGPG